MQERIQTFFQDRAELMDTLGSELSEDIEKASLTIVNTLLNEGKIISCGNGVSAICADYFTSKLLNHFVQERPSLPAITLNNHPITTAIMDDYGTTEIYAKQIRALGNNKDILLTITHHNNSANMVEAIHAAHDRDMTIIALTGAGCTEIKSSLLTTDIEVCVPSDKIVHIQEAHLLITDAICNLIDYQLFGSD